MRMYISLLITGITFDECATIPSVKTYKNLFCVYIYESKKIRNDTKAVLSSDRTENCLNYKVFLELKGRALEQEEQGY